RRRGSCAGPGHGILCLLLGGYGLGLDGGDGDGVDDVLHGGAAGEVVDGEAEALHDGADGDGAGAALHGFVGVVAGVEVGEDEDGGAPGDLRVGEFGAGDGGVGGGVVLDGSVDGDA